MIDKHIADLLDEMIDLRRDFHKHPELGYEEKRTGKIIAEYLRGLGMEVHEGIGVTGVVGLLRGESPGRTVMLRADMDALPIQEESDAEYRSIHDGVMHACGHDGHMAILMGTAGVLNRMKDSFSGCVKFVFQPAEESLGGAKKMIEDGVLENPHVDAAFGLHLISMLPTGYIGWKYGPIMAGMDSFTITIKGKGGHCAMPEGGVDAILISAQVISALQSLATREISPLSPAVIHVGTIHGGNAPNVIADRVVLEGTVRTLDKHVQELIGQRMERLLAGITQAMGGSFELEYTSGYPVTVNDADMTDMVKAAGQQVVGLDHLLEMPPAMASEDMSLYLQRVPGSYFYVGARNTEKGFVHPHHNSLFDFDEHALTTGAAMMCRLAISFLDGR
ncbi:MAG TPA: amidohydrolase [Deltaproteobacteria bacterium]|nr:amidohydrolase [Deltaproteobacteria bacterium]